MSNQEAFDLIGKRAKQLSIKPEVQSKMVQMAKEDKGKAEKWLYMLAIATLI